VKYTARGECTAHRFPLGAKQLNKMNGEVKLLLICFMTPCRLLERSKVLTSSSLSHNTDRSRKPGGRLTAMSASYQQLLFIVEQPVTDQWAYTFSCLLLFSSKSSIFPYHLVWAISSLAFCFQLLLLIINIIIIMMMNHHHHHYQLHHCRYTQFRGTRNQE
jgi:hypothetical protein